MHRAVDCTADHAHRRKLKRAAYHAHRLIHCRLDKNGIKAGSLQRVGIFRRLIHNCVHASAVIHRAGQRQAMHHANQNAALFLHPLNDLHITSPFFSALFPASGRAAFLASICCNVGAFVVEPSSSIIKEETVLPYCAQVTGSQP